MPLSGSAQVSEPAALYRGNFDNAPLRLFAAGFLNIGSQLARAICNFFKPVIAHYRVKIERGDIHRCNGVGVIIIAGTCTFSATNPIRFNNAAPEIPQNRSATTQFAK
jgi:hypothetical protein